MAKLIVNPTSSSRREIPLTRTLMSIGRDPSNDVVLPDAMVSRRHAVIEYRGSQYLLRDCNSSNGSLVNGDRVSERIAARRRPGGDRHRPAALPRRGDARRAPARSCSILRRRACSARRARPTTARATCSAGSAARRSRRPRRPRPCAPPAARWCRCPRGSATPAARRCRREVGRRRRASAAGGPIRRRRLRRPDESPSAPASVEARVAAGAGAAGAERGAARRRPRRSWPRRRRSRRPPPRRAARTRAPPPPRQDRRRCGRSSRPGSRPAPPRPIRVVPTDPAGVPAAGAVATTPSPSRARSCRRARGLRAARRQRRVVDLAARERGAGRCSSARPRGTGGRFRRARTRRSWACCSASAERPLAGIFGIALLRLLLGRTGGHARQAAAGARRPGRRRLASRSGPRGPPCGSSATWSRPPCSEPGS